MCGSQDPTVAEIHTSTAAANADVGKAGVIGRRGGITASIARDNDHSRRVANER